MALRDLLAEENKDASTAANAAAMGRSLTGMSGKHTLFGEEVKTPSGGFLGAQEPIVGERVAGVGEDAFLQGVRSEAQERKPFGSMEQILAYPPRPGYRRYWFNDVPGRISRAKEAGYTHVIDRNGNPVSRITDKADGRGRASYLMEYPMKWYQEDMARQARELSDRLNDIRTGRAGPGAADNRYIPQQGIRIEGR